MLKYIIKFSVLLVLFFTATDLVVLLITFEITDSSVSQYRLLLKYAGQHSGMYIIFCCPSTEETKALSPTS